MTNYTVTQMYPTTYRKKNWGSEETTKKCVSFPQHEENLIDDWKILAKMDYVSESQYVRKLIRDEASRRLPKARRQVAIIGA